MTTDPARPAAGRLLTGNLLGIAAMVAWAAGFPAAGVLLADWDPPLLVAARFLMALAVLIPLWLLREGPGALAQVPWLRGMAIGAAGFGGSALTILLSQWYTDPVTVAIFAATTPLCATVVDWVVLGRGFSRGFLLGLVAALVGGLVATGTGVPGSIGLGALFAVISGLLFSWGTLMTIRHMAGQSGLGQISVTATGATLALAGLALVLWAAGWVSPPAGPVTLATLGLLAIHGVVAYALSQVLWIASAQRLGVAVASFHVNVAPFYTMLILLALGGDWSWPQAIGAAIVALGVVVAQR